MFDWLQQTGDFIQRMIATRNLTFMLCCGIAVLSIAWGVLTRTRWGHAKPVSKCIALSILAHVLLFGYAWGTKFVLSVPARDNSNPTTVSLVNEAPEEKPRSGDEQIDPEQNESKDDDATENASTENDLKPWEKFDTAKAPTHEPLTEQTVSRPEIIQPQTAEKPTSKLPEPAIIQPSVPAPQENVVNAEPTPVPTQLASAVTMRPNLNNAPTIDSQKDVLSGAPSEIEIQRRSTELANKAQAQSDPVTPAKMEIAGNLKLVEPRKQSTSPGLNVDKMANNVIRNAANVVDQNSQQANFETVAERIERSTRSTSELPKIDLQSIGVTTKRLDGSVMPEIYRMRTANDRMAAVKKLGGSEQTERAVKQALKWLAANQQKDGRWNPRLTGGGQEKNVLGHPRDGAGTNADTGITALALLAFLGAGHTQQDGEYKDTIQRGLDFLISKQRTNGSLAGDARLYAQTYCHSMSLLALSEALAITGDTHLRNAVQSGVKFSVRAQNRNDGGWRYQVGDAGDMSQFGWQVMALKAAKAGGVNVPDDTFDRMKKFLQLCARGASGGLAAYRPVERSSVTMTAEALLCRFFLNDKVDPAAIEEATAFIERALPQPTQANYYYWYYGTLAMFHAGGQRWDKWNNELCNILVKQQNSVGGNAGSWDPNGMWAGYGGRVYSTAMATLCLEVYYRYLDEHP